MPRLVGINHVAVEVGDLDEALAFYGRIFDLTLRGRMRDDGVRRHGRPVPRAVAGRRQPPDEERHIGLVVDDREAALAAAREAGAELLGDNDFRDPWGNHFQVVDYRDIQFTKTDRILAGWASTGSRSRSGRTSRKGLAKRGCADFLSAR